MLGEKMVVLKRVAYDTNIRSSHMKNKFLKSNKLKLFLVITVGLSLLGMNSHLKVVKYKIHTDKVETPIKIVLLTDLHSCDYGANQILLINEIHKAKPDIILLGGDIFDDHMADENTLITLKAIANDYPCFYVTGNHEIWSGRADDMKRTLNELNIKVLEGENEIVSIRDQKINICGIDDPSINGYNTEKDSFDTQLNQLKDVHENGYYTILLTHRPEYIAQYATYDFDLVLSGHAHGGQWRIPGIMNGLLAPDQGFFPKYAGGRFTYDATELIVSRGLAKESTGVPRIFNRPELVVITIE